MIPSTDIESQCHESVFVLNLIIIIIMNERHPIVNPRYTETGMEHQSYGEVILTGTPGFFPGSTEDKPERYFCARGSSGWLAISSSKRMRAAS